MKIKRFKLTSMVSAVINSKEMVSLIGGTGTDCSCSCYYENQGGASTNDNKMANYAHGYDSEHRNSCTTTGYNSEDGDLPVVFPKGK